jgi:hypothetical protein
MKKMLLNIHKIWYDFIKQRGVAFTIKSSFQSYILSALLATRRKLLARPLPIVVKALLF